MRESRRHVLEDSFGVLSVVVEVDPPGIFVDLAPVSTCLGLGRQISVPKLYKALRYEGSITSVWGYHKPQCEW